MLLNIIVWPTVQKSFKNTAKPGTKGYLRPAAAFRDDPDSPELITAVEIQRCDAPEADSPLLEVIPISNVLSDAVATFVNDHLGKQTGFDCYDFVNLIGSKPRHKSQDTNRHWSVHLCLPGDVTPGEVVAFGDTSHYFRHAAVCVAPDLYLSVFGINGDLEFATLADLREPYEIANVYKLQ